MEFPTFKQTFNTPGIDLLPHREPFLFVDELISADETGALGRYTFTAAMCQVAGAAVVARRLLPEGQAAFILGSIDKVRFRRPVRPGDTLVTVAQNVKVMSKLGVFALKGYVGDELAAQAEVKCVLGTQDKLPA